MIALEAILGCFSPSQWEGKDHAVLSKTRRGTRRRSADPGEVGFRVLGEGGEERGGKAKGNGTMEGEEEQRGLLYSERRAGADVRRKKEMWLLQRACSSNRESCVGDTFRCVPSGWVAADRKSVV